MLTLQGFLIFTHVGKVRLRKGFEVRQLFPPSLDFVASSKFIGSRILTALGRTEGKSLCFLDGASERSRGFGHLGREIKSCTNEKGCVCFGNRSATSQPPAGGWRECYDEKCQLSRFSCDDFLTLQALAVVAANAKFLAQLVLARALAKGPFCLPLSFTQLGP
jgi:hypothetical protein